MPGQPTLADQIRFDAQDIVAAVGNDLSVLKDKHVLVTGGTGLIGTYILAVLDAVSRRWPLRSVTYTSRISPANFATAEVVKTDSCGFVWKQADLTNPEHVRSLPYADIIIHAAGYGQPAKFMADPLKTIQLNTSTVWQLAEHLVSNGRFLFLSSSEVYSGNKNTPHDEEYMGTTNPQHERGAYIEGKRCGEAICHNLNRDDKHFKIARVSLAYGPGTAKDDDRVINQFIQRAITEKVVVCRDSGRAIRTYNYIADCVEMLFNILLKGKRTAYNVGGVHHISIADLATLVASLSGASLVIPKDDRNQDHTAPATVYSSIDRYRCEFPKPKFVDMPTGVQRTIEWQRILYGKT